MKKIKLLLPQICLLVLLYSCNANDEKIFLDRLSKSIKDQENDTTIIYIDSLTTFNWDTLFIFKAYMSGNDINKHLGMDWAKEGNVSWIGTESYTLFVFKNGDKIVNDFLVPRKTSKEFGFLKKVKYSKKNAKFLSIKGNYLIEDLPH